MFFYTNRTVCLLTYESSLICEFVVRNITVRTCTCRRFYDSHKFDCASVILSFKIIICGYMLITFCGRLASINMLVVVETSRFTRILNFKEISRFQTKILYCCCVDVLYHLRNLPFGKTLNLRTGIKLYFWVLRNPIT